MIFTIFTDLYYISGFLLLQCNWNFTKPR